ncbi:glutamate receptor ionotropic, delta-1-like [Macrobrachium nipponense]|uniref:glutamate receptor ionotropic, delta-1-like n=1 Tax=Macrobrachium nipponense TaxID=159736 RepID=UPI0030C8306B
MEEREYERHPGPSLTMAFCDYWLKFSAQPVQRKIKAPEVQLILFGQARSSSQIFRREMLDLNTANINSSIGIVNVLLAVLSEVGGDSNIRLQLLYDEFYAEDINKLFHTREAKEGVGVTMFKYDGGIDTLTFMLASPKGTTLALALCSPQNFIDIFRKMRLHELKSYTVSWLLINRDGELTGRLQQDLESQIYEGTQVTLITNASKLRFRVFSTMVDHTGQKIFVNEGIWNKERSLLQLVMGSENQHDDLHGRQLKVAANDFAGFIEMSQDSEVPSGVDAEIVIALGQFLNFTYKIVRPADGMWGNPLPNGTVTGIIGMVARHEASFAICAVAVSYTRETVVDFAYPYHREPLAIFTRAPKLKSRALAILSPFTLQVWLCVAASTLITGFVVRLQAKASNEHDWSFQQCVFDVFRNLVYQALYSGTLTSYLAVPSYETPVDSLYDLPKAIKDGYTLGILKDTTNELLFREAKEGIYKQVWDLFNHKNPEESFIDRPETGIHKILEKKFLFIEFKISNEILIGKIGKAKFHVARQAFYYHGIGIACPPGAPYISAFSKMLLRMGEGGLIQKWFKNEIDKVSHGKSEDNGNKEIIGAIGLDQLQAAFFMVLIGSLAATLAFVVEVSASHLKCFRFSDSSN